MSTSAENSLPPGRDGARVTSGAVELVVRQRAAIEVVLRRHRVPPGEAAALVAAAVVAVTATDRAGEAPAGSEGRLVRALEIACARRGGPATKAGGVGPDNAAVPANAWGAGEAAVPGGATVHDDGADAATPSETRGTFDASFAARLSAALPDGAELATGPDPAAHSAAPSEPKALFAGVVARVAREARDLDERLAAERRRAPALAASALARPGTADPAPLASRGVVEHLLAAATAAWVEDARRARALAALAVVVVRRLDAELYGAVALADLEARALATLGNAERVVGDLAAADARLAEAGRVLARGSRDPRARADLLRLQATLRRAQGRRDESLRLLDQAAAIYRWLGDGHCEARTLLLRAMLFEETDPRQAAALARRALAGLDLPREPRLELVAVHNLAMYHHRAGELDRAEALLPRIAAAAARIGGHLDRLRLRWLAAQIAADRGDDGVEAELAAVRDAFVAHEMPLDALLATLDLAALHLARGRVAQTRRLAEELVALVAHRPLDRQVLSTLLVFRQAARAERATAALVEAAAAALRRAGERAAPPPPPS